MFMKCLAGVWFIISHHYYYCCCYLSETEQHFLRHTHGRVQTRTHTHLPSERNKFFCSKLWFLKPSIGGGGVSRTAETTVVEAGAGVGGALCKGPF